MTITAALAAALTVLTEALDEPHTDIGHSLELLTLYTAAAVPSYRGLSVVVPQGDPPLTFTTSADGDVTGDVLTSLYFTLPGRGDSWNSSAVVIVLYADSPGTFVDLAADLAWLTGRPPADFVLDQHPAFAKSVPGRQLHAASAVNQALGVLIGRGYTPQQAHRQLEVHAAHHRTDKAGAARLILGTLTPSDDGGHVPSTE